MKVIGLTGGIGSGKTLVSDYLLAQGYAIIDADVIARHVVAPNTEGLKQVIAAFGQNLLQADGSLDRRQLATIVFNDATKRKQLEAITHRLIKDEITKKLSQYEKAEKTLVFVVVPLLFEAGFDAMADEVWLVTADREIRLDRIIKRDNLSYEEASKRLAAQMPESEKIAKSDHVIYNNQGVMDVYQQVGVLLQKRSC